MLLKEELARVGPAKIGSNWKDNYMDKKDKDQQVRRYML